MRTTTTLAVASTLLSANAINLVKRQDGPARVVEGSIQRKSIVDPIEHDRRRFRKRQDNTITVTLDNEETLYFMNATIGTPSQSFRLHLDTGSSDLWVNVANSDLCEDPQNGCDVSGTYSANDSSTYQYLNSFFNISYVDGSGSSGDYATDSVTFGGVTLKDQQFGIGYVSSSAEGIVGIGYPLNEVAVAYQQGRTYANVPQHLLWNGDIATNAYSLWLNDLESSTGSILFGGVNTDKYTGSLETLPILKEEGGEYAEFIIALTAVGQNGNSGSLASNIAASALLDSGSTLMYLPDDVADSIYDAVGAEYDSRQGVAFIDCDAANSDDTVDFTFSSPTIRVPMNELVITAAVERGQPICILGIMRAEGSTPVLGDTFLRSAYVVYDITNNEISLAQTVFNATTDNIMEITNSSVPDATLVQNAVTSVSVQTGGARIGSYDTTITEGIAGPTPAPAWNMAMLGAVGAVAAFAL